MDCKKGGTTNTKGIATCQSCGCDLVGKGAVREEPRLCMLGLTAMVLGIVVPSIIVIIFFGLYLNSGFAELVFLRLLLFCWLGSFVLGILSWIRIALSHGRLYGKECASVALAISGLVGFLGFGLAMLRLSGPGDLSFRMTCQTNLSGIGKAMLIYSNDYDDKLPKAGAATNTWTDSLGGNGNSRAWCAKAREEIGNGPDGTTVSASLYLLVKYAEVTPKSFVCKGEGGVSEFKLSDWEEYVAPGTDLIDVWDFGFYAGPKKNQSKHVSYAYHHPFDDSSLTVAHEPSMAVAADRSPWCKSAGDRMKQWTSFHPDIDPNSGNAESGEAGNSLTHQGEGQSVLYLDSHVEFEKRAFVGIENDNIYTIQATDGLYAITKGKLPTIYDAEASRPGNKQDSVLLNQENGSGRKSD